MRFMWVLYFRRGHFDVDDDGSQRCLQELCWVVDGVCIQDDQLKRLGQLKDPLDLALNLGCQRTRERQGGVTFNGATSLLKSKKAEASILSSYSSLFSTKTSKSNFLFAHPGWSACWISPLWPSCSAPSASPATDQQSPV